jgi:predicted MFS family arabinose efflux permease
MPADSPPRRVVWVMAAAAGLSAGNLYYAQPLLEAIARTFSATRAAVGLLVTMTQLGYALGLLVLVPLGDLLERRALVVTVLLGTALALVGAGLSPSLPLLAAASLAVGLTSVVAQIVVPFAASLATDRNRGRVVGTVMSGLLLGILGARTVAGVVGDLFGWRIMYLAAAGAMLLLAAVLAVLLPRYVQEPRIGYPALLRSTFRLVVEEPLLRRRAFYGGMMFACFSVLWTSLSFLLSRPPYGYRESVIGLFGLIGIAGVLAASSAGRLADRGHTRTLTRAGLALVVGSFALLAWGGQALAPLVAGIVLLDLGVQGIHITNQSVIYTLRPEARSRLTSVYMTSYFLGGATGSAAAAVVFDRGGWLPTCALGVGFGGVALAVALLSRGRPT